LRPELVVTAIHNFFLDAAFEGGVLMSVGLMIWAFWISRRLFQASRLTQRGLGMDMAKGLLIGTVCFVAKGLFNNNPLYTYGTGVWMAYWFSFPLLAITVLQNHKSGETHRSEKTRAVSSKNRILQPAQALRVGGARTSPQTEFYG